MSASPSPCVGSAHGRLSHRSHIPNVLENALTFGCDRKALRSRPNSATGIPKLFGIRENHAIAAQKASPKGDAAWLATNHCRKYRIFLYSPFKREGGGSQADGRSFQDSGDDRSFIFTSSFCVSSGRFQPFGLLDETHPGCAYSLGAQPPFPFSCSLREQVSGRQVGLRPQKIPSLK